MKQRSIITFFATVGIAVILVSAGCRHRRGPGDRMASGGENGREEVAPSDATADGKEYKFTLVDKGDQEIDFAQHEEIRRAYHLLPNSPVNINEIDGQVDIETANTETAEVLIIRSAKKSEDLQFHRIRIKHDEGRLNIYVRNDRGRSIFSSVGSIPEGHQRVILRLPSKIHLSVSRINGQVNIGAIDGKVRMDGINGQVKVARASNEFRIDGISGNIEATIARLTGGRIELNGINGNTKLHFMGDVNADVRVAGINGQVEANLPNVTVLKSDGFGSYQSRIGTGGAPISANGINGNIYLSRAEKTAADSASAGTLAK